MTSTDCAAPQDGSLLWETRLFFDDDAKPKESPDDSDPGDEAVQEAPALPATPPAQLLAGDKAVIVLSRGVVQARGGGGGMRCTGARLSQYAWTGC